jgi:hypothetical protein
MTSGFNPLNLHLEKLLACSKMERGLKLYLPQYIEGDHSPSGENCISLTEGSLGNENGSEPQRTID